MAFDPKEHLIKVGGKQYLPAQARIVWFRDVYPNGAIVSELVTIEPFPVYKATVMNNDGVILAVDYGSAQPKAGAVWAGREIEKACTAAISRALALAGFGTLFSLEYEENDHLADTPQEPRKSQNGKSKPRPTFVANPDMWDKMLAFIRNEGLDDFNLLEALNLPDLNTVQALPCDDTGRAEIKAKIASFKAQAVQA